MSSKWLIIHVFDKSGSVCTCFYWSHGIFTGTNCLAPISIETMEYLLVPTVLPTNLLALFYWQLFYCFTGTDKSGSVCTNFYCIMLYQHSNIRFNYQNSNLTQRFLSLMRREATRQSDLSSLTLRSLQRGACTGTETPHSLRLVGAQRHHNALPQRAVQVATLCLTPQWIASWSAVALR